MVSRTEATDKIKKDKAKQAVTLAMQSKWDEAVHLNKEILQEFPNDVEACNRLGKALMELGRNKEAVEAFRQALHFSPYNTIAQKNLDRLSELGESISRVSTKSTAAPRVFIEESGKAARTALFNLGQLQVRLNLSPGDPLELRVEGNSLTVMDDQGQYVGLVDPRLAARLARLMKGGNRYEAAVTSVNKDAVGIIIRETYKHPSQIHVVSFPSRTIKDAQATSTTVIDYDLSDDDEEDPDRPVVKDWSDDDTEPGDDEAFTPAIHRIINPDDDDSDGDEEERSHDNDDY
ncbi:MAG: tetratricopeptide repeat protein [Chloroflexi bacterium]|nr:tetratricopeptide repeat protein [Chloroflexota bacterium]